MKPKSQITNEKLKQSVLITLADQEMVRIMNSVILHSKSITEIIRETDIPHTTAYRKIKWMLAQDLLTVERIVVSKDGKKFSLIRSVFKSIDVRYQYHDVIIEVERNVDILQKTAQKIFTLES